MTAQSSVSAIQRARHMLRTRVSEHPALYLSFARRKYPGPSPEVISSQTEFVIDGYTRSASTFAVYALQLSQDKPVRLAHHLHAPAQLIRAARRGVPALVLIREPQGAVLSQCLLPYYDKFVVADFEEVTSDFGSVIRRVNKQFGTTFAEFKPTQANISECFELIKHRGTLSKTLLGFESGLVTRDDLRPEQEALARQSALLDTREAWVPSGDRDRMKAALRDQWRGPDLAKRRARAQRVYHTFVTGQGCNGSAN